jgi:hypothetical protein
MSPKQEKTKEERLQEGITLLKSLKEAGIKEKTLSYMTLKKHITEWITTGKTYEEVLQMEEYGRMAVLSLPRWNNRVAELTLKIKKT